MSIYFPKREELSFRFVLAFPKASKTGLLPINLTLTASTFFLCLVAAAMNSKIFFDASVFPDPDSPKEIFILLIIIILLINKVV